MRLVLVLPTRIALDQAVSELVFPGLDGNRCLRPRHTDFVSPTVAGILSFVQEGEQRRRYFGVDRGLLVKCGDLVRLSVREAVSGELEQLARVVRDEYVTRRESEATARSALARLEAGFVRGLLEVLEGQP